jgi:hypothetical protein
MLRPAARRSKRAAVTLRLRLVGSPGKLVNSWQIGFLRSIPQEGKSENSREFTGDLNGGPGWT